MAIGVVLLPMTKHSFSVRITSVGNVDKAEPEKEGFMSPTEVHKAASVEAACGSVLAYCKKYLISYEHFQAAVVTRLSDGKRACCVHHNGRFFAYPHAS